MSDILKGKDLAIAQMRMNATFGLGSIVGPAIGARLLAKTGSIKACYIARAPLAAVQVAHNWFTLKETLDVKERKELSLKGLNPFGFVKLLGEGSILIRMVAIQTLVSMSEAKNLIDLKTLWLKQNLKLGIDKVSLEQTLYGLMMLLSGTYVAPKVIKELGQRAFTSLALLTSATGFLLWAKSKTSLMWIGLALLLPGINATSASVIKARAIDQAAEQGMGKGEIGSYIANLRALTVVASPVLYGEVYARFMTRHGGQGNLTWILVACITSIVPEILHRSLPEAAASEVGNSLPMKRGVS
jgi:cation transporter-like permease